MDETPQKPRGPITLLLTSRRFQQWAIVGAILSPVLYVLSFGPSCWLTSSPIPEYDPPELIRVYWPLGSLAGDQSSVGATLRWWIEFGLPADHYVMVPCDLSGETWAGIGGY